jgi:hypothetical protein
MGADRATAPGQTPARVDKRAQVNAAAADWPLRFEPNVGQVKGADSRDVRYVSRGSSYTLFLTPTEAVLALQQHARGSAGKTSPLVVRMRLAGGSKVPALTGLDELPTKSNYLIGNDPAQWHTDVANYGRVAEKDVYPGIDLVYHGNQGQLEYDFEVAPQADPKKIGMALEGAQSLRIDSQGDLLVKVERGELRFRRPVAYQKADGAERLVPVHYILKGKNRVEFRLASYDVRQPLVIDPILAYSTYLGGAGRHRVHRRWYFLFGFPHGAPVAAQRRRAPRFSPGRFCRQNQRRRVHFGLLHVSGWKQRGRGEWDRRGRRRRSFRDRDHFLA